MSRWLALALATWLAVCALPPARAQDQSITQDANPEQPAVEPSAVEAVEARAREVAAELQRVKDQIAAAGEPIAEHQRQVQDMLERVGLVLNEQLATHQQIRESQEALAGLQQSLTEFRLSGPAERPPYSVLQLDAIRNELQTLRGRAETLDAGITAATQAKEEARATLAQKESARRRAKEVQEANTAETGAGELAQALRLAELESRLATEQLGLRGLDIERQRVLKESFEAKLALLGERDAWISRETTFSDDDLRSKLIELEAKEEQLREQLDLAQRRLPWLESQWLDARRRLETETGAHDVLAEEVAARRLSFLLRQREVAILSKRLQRLGRLKDVWKNRFAVWQPSTDRAELSKWNEESRAFLEELDSEYSLQDLELRDLAQDLVSLQGRLEALTPEQADAARWIRDQIQRTNELDQLLESNVASINSARLVAERLLSDIGGRIKTVKWRERIADIWRTAVSAWRFEITSVDDRAITVGKIIIGLSLLVLGFFAARLISGWLGRKLLPRLGMNEGAAAAIRSIVFYILIVSFVFIALRAINVPLTAFTILGGAVAIGVGFGSQNIMNNFMSGLILLVERPVRVGDLIQIGDLYGVVQHLGARSTRVLTGDNVEIVVPNSSFLENNVVNWTLSETKVRIFVSVGVTYGSPTREVSRLLLKAVEEHGRTLKSPAPVVLFTEFGDNSLNFEVHFWIVMRRLMDRRIIESDIRYLIDGMFREAGIVIAFPQRDVHLDVGRPLDVRMLPPDPPASPETPGSN